MSTHIGIDRTGSDDPRPRCTAALSLAGENYPCDLVAEHSGWAHSSLAAQAIWRGTRAVEGSPDGTGPQPSDPSAKRVGTSPEHANETPESWHVPYSSDPSGDTSLDGLTEGQLADETATWEY